jgi:hypothetical protein
MMLKGASAASSGLSAGAARGGRFDRLGGQW